MLIFLYCKEKDDEHLIFLLFCNHCFSKPCFRQSFWGSSGEKYFPTKRLQCDSAQKFFCFMLVGIFILAHFTLFSLLGTIW